MATLPTFDELYELGRAEVLARRPDLTDWSEGSGNDAYIGAGAVQADEVIRVVIDQFAALFLDTADGQALIDLAKDRFNLEPNPATAAVGTIRWSRGRLGISYTIPVGTRVRAVVDGQSVVFATTQAGAVGPGMSTAHIAVACLATGRVGNVAAGTITEVLDPIAVDPGAIITNVERASGGADAETPEAFRDRVRRYYPTLRRGTPEALETGALSVPGVWYATVDERQVETHGHVLVYVGDPDGAGNALLADQVAAELEGWRAAGIRVVVLPSAREEVALALRVRIRAGVDTRAIESAIKAAITVHVDNLAPSATLYLSQVERAALRVSDDVLDAVVTSHDEHLTPGEPQNALRLAPGGLQIAFVEVR